MATLAWAPWRQHQPGTATRKERILLGLQALMQPPPSPQHYAETGLVPVAGASLITRDREVSFMGWFRLAEPRVPRDSALTRHGRKGANSGGSIRVRIRLQDSPGLSRLPCGRCSAPTALAVDCRCRHAGYRGGARSPRLTRRGRRRGRVAPVLAPGIDNGALSQLRSRGHPAGLTTLGHPLLRRRHPPLVARPTGSVARLLDQHVIPRVSSSAGTRS